MQAGTNTLDSNTNAQSRVSTLADTEMKKKAQKKNKKQNGTVPVKKMAMKKQKKKIHRLKENELMQVLCATARKTTPREDHPHALRFEGQGDARSALPVQSSSRFANGEDFASGARPACMCVVQSL